MTEGINKYRLGGEITPENIDRLLIEGRLDEDQPIFIHYKGGANPDLVVGHSLPDDYNGRIFPSIYHDHTWDNGQFTLWAGDPRDNLAPDPEVWYDSSTKGVWPFFYPRDRFMLKRPFPPPILIDDVNMPRMGEPSRSAGDGLEGRAALRKNKWWKKSKKRRGSKK